MKCVAQLFEKHLPRRIVLFADQNIFNARVLIRKFMSCVCDSAQGNRMIPLFGIPAPLLTHALAVCHCHVVRYLHDDFSSVCVFDINVFHGKIPPMRFEKKQSDEFRRNMKKPDCGRTKPNAIRL